MSETILGTKSTEELRDCHYCENAACLDSIGSVDCYGDFGYFDHTVKDPKEAENCSFFEFCDIFPKT